MKRLKYLALGLAVVCIPNFVSAAELHVDDEGDLDACLAIDGNTCIVDFDINLTAEIEIGVGQTVIIDLNGNDITGSNTLATLFRITNGSLTIKGTGNINAENYAFYVNGNTVLGGSAIKAELNVENGVVATSQTSCVMFIKGKGAKATIDAKFIGNGNKYATISGNGTKTASTDNGNTEIIINKNAHIEATNGMHAIYHPQSGTLTVNGGTIKGDTGIEMRSGNLIVNGGTIISTATTTTVASNGNGSAVSGAAIAVAQHTTAQEASITINGGTLEGPTALLEETPEDNSVPAKVTLEVNGGNFVATNNGAAVSSANKTGFINGGTFNEDLTSDDAKKTYLATNTGTESKVDEETGNLLVGVPYGIELKETKNGKAELEQETALKGETVKVTTTPDKGYKVKEVKVTTTDGQKVEVKDNKFTMPENDVEIEVTFEVINPDTADNIAIYFATLLISVMAIAVVSLRKRYN